MAPLNIEVEYIYILNDWFRKSEYKDVLDYVISVGCQYYFHYLPLQKLGLPVPRNRNRIGCQDFCVKKLTRAVFRYYAG